MCVPSRFRFDPEDADVESSEAGRKLIKIEKEAQEKGQPMGTSLGPTPGLGGEPQGKPSGRGQKGPARETCHVAACAGDVKLPVAHCGAQVGLSA